MQIKDLEEQLGTALFERGARQVRLTGFGEELRRPGPRDPALGRRTWRSRPGVARAAGRAAAHRRHPDDRALPAAHHHRRAHPRACRARHSRARNHDAQAAAGAGRGTARYRDRRPAGLRTVASTEVALFSEEFVLVRPGGRRRKAGAGCRDAARNAAAAARRGPLLPRPGAVVLQHPDRAAARGARRQLAVDPGADGRRRHRRDPDPRNGGGRSKPARPRSPSRASKTRSPSAPSA